uniref:Phosphodiesterase n=1 Tax=Anthoceros agrestis TaxID=41834 RepID=A0A8D5GBY9_9EMBR|nr:bifunctional adenylyl cyclase/cAMP phosphodiesterase [Anthoceros agrestis]
MANFDEDGTTKLSKTIDSWSFDIFQIEDKDLPEMVEMIFKKLDLFETFALQPQKFRAFVRGMVARYQPNPYHNFRHACDVLHATYMLLTTCAARHMLNAIEIFSIVLAALCHDVDHPGLTNSFLITTYDPLALRYNDISVLENHHASTTFLTIWSDENVDILSSFYEEEKKKIRKIVLSLILATDMDQHGKIMSLMLSRRSTSMQFEKSMQIQNVTNFSSIIIQHDEERKTTLQHERAQFSNISSDATLLCQMIIKCADLSNVMKPFFLARRWASLLLLEWFNQGDMERKLGLPISRFMERGDASALISMTTGCIDLIAKPMYEATAFFLPKLYDEAIVLLSNNRDNWMLQNFEGQSAVQVAETILGEYFPRNTMSFKLASNSFYYQINKRISPNIVAHDQLNETSTKTEDILCKEADKTSMHASPSVSPLLPTVVQATQNNDLPLSLLFGTASKEDSIIMVSDTARGTPLKESILHSKLQLVVKPTDSTSTCITSNIKNLSQSQLGEYPAFVISHSCSKLEGKEGNKVLTICCHRLWTTLRKYTRIMKLNKALDSKAWVSIIISATLIALFIDDFTKALLPKEADVYETHLLIICFTLFVLDILALSMLREEYFAGFFFWLDLLGTFSLIPTICETMSPNLMIAKTGRAAKSVTRASKLMQASRFSNLLLISRFMKIVYQKPSILNIENKVRNDENELIISKPSQVWSTLAELTTQKLITGILVLIVITPLLSKCEKDLAPVMSLNTFEDVELDTQEFESILHYAIKFYNMHNYKILYLGVKPHCDLVGTFCNTTYIQVIPNSTIKNEEKNEIEKKYRQVELLIASSDDGRSEAYFTIKKSSVKKYIMNMCQTIILLIVLAAWCFFLSRDSNILLIQPIERMVSFVKELAEDPVSFAGKSFSQETKPAPMGRVMETRVVEAALVKIASLTKVALGNAGMDILSANLKGAEFNPMIPGKKIRACFGFCDIRNFTDATECLQEEVMMFVNKIAEVVHNKVILHHGFPNKNIGDAFLIVWKKTISDTTSSKTRGISFADRALRSFLDIIQAVETSQTLADFAKHPAIQRRMPGYRIHMGFGLHVGWAIEGAIGSSHKVDPSYLSPHVNMASRLEAATKQYGVMILISETVISHLTKSSLRASCRKLDRVTVKGSVEPLFLYTYDLPLFQQELKGHPSDYRDLFEFAVDNYIQGKWDIALQKLEECLQLWPSDKPIQVLMSYMASYNYRSPLNWLGYRELTEK